MSIENQEFLSVNKKIKIIGAGDCGVNTVRHMIASTALDVEYIFADRGLEDDQRCLGHKFIQLNRHRQHLRRQLDQSRVADELADGGFRPSIEGAGTLFIIVGMGGRTGQQVAPEMARISRSMGIFTIAIVTMPCEYEMGRVNYANLGLPEVQANFDSVMVMSNEKLIEILGDNITNEEFYAYGYDLLKTAIVDMVQIIAEPNNTNISSKNLQPLWCATVDRFNDQYGIGISESKP